MHDLTLPGQDPQKVPIKMIARVIINGSPMLKFCKELSTCNWGLRAFGALLESASFEKFFSKNEQADAYRKGLNLLVMLFVENQEEKLRALMEIVERELEADENNDFKAIDLVKQAK